MSNEYKGIHVQQPFFMDAEKHYYKEAFWGLKQTEFEKAKNRVIEFDRQQREQSFFAISNDLPKAVNEIQQARIERLERKLTTLRMIVFIMAVIIISMLVK